MKNFLIIIFLIVVCTNVMASAPQRRAFQTQADFEKGEAKGISITSKGELQLAPAITEIGDPKESVIWTFVVDKAGKIFFSAGNEGKVYVIENNSAPKLLCKLDEIEIHALALDNKNALFAATSPDGKVYRISREGKAVIFYDPPDKYIWDLLFDKENNLYVATGDSGVVYKVKPTGEGMTFYQSDESQIRCLTWDKNGELLAGGFGNGYIYRINLKGEPFVIYDSNLKEIHQIEVDEDGTIYAAALGQPPGIMPVPTEKPVVTKQEDKTTVTEEIEGEIIIGEIQIEAPAPTAARERFTESSIIKMMSNGIIKNIWDSSKEPVQSIILEKKGTLLVGTGKTGKLVRIDPDDEKTILLGLDESQVTAFGKNQAGEILFGTANMGKLFQLNLQFRATGNYTSEVIDGYTISKWGSISWEHESPSGCEIKLYTRTGNTEKPNRTWSNWSSAYIHNEGENIQNQDARFCQWKLELFSQNKNVTAKVKKVSISYLQQNLPPEIDRITIYPAGEYYQDSDVDFEAKTSSLSEVLGSSSDSKPQKRNQFLGRKSYRKGYQTVNWQVIDYNNDKLIYHLWYRAENDRTWKKLSRNWQSTAFSWDTERFPDGIYYLKLAASDSLTNPYDFYRSTEKISDPFIIDNTGPQIINSSVEKKSSQNIIAFTVEDQFNPIDKVFYSIDGEEWKLLYPIDNISDSKMEKFVIKTTQSKGSHSVVIKAMDAINNMGFGRIYFED